MQLLIWEQREEHRAGDSSPASNREQVRNRGVHKRGLWVRGSLLLSLCRPFQLKNFKGVQMSFSQRKAVKVPVWSLSGDADSLVGWSPRSASRKGEIRSGPAELFPDHPHSRSTAPSCACLFPGITGLLLRKAALPRFPAGPWKERGHPCPPGIHPRTGPSPHTCCVPQRARAPPGAQPGLLPPSLSRGKVNKSGDFVSPLLNTYVRAEEEAVRSPLSLLSHSLVPLSCAVWAVLPSGRAASHWDFR